MRACWEHMMNGRASQASRGLYASPLVRQSSVGKMMVRRNDSHRTVGYTGVETPARGRTAMVGEIFGSVSAFKAMMDIAKCLFGNCLSLDVVWPGLTGSN